jgi:hypothetical protein
VNREVVVRKELAVLLRIVSGQHYVSRRIAMMEVPPLHIPHLRSLSSYRTPQTSQNHKIKILLD